MIVARYCERCWPAGTGTAVTALGSQAAYAAFSPPVRGRRYQKYGGHNFTPISTVKNTQRTDWTYNDNGSIYVTGTPTLFGTRLQLPGGAVIEEVQSITFSAVFLPWREQEAEWLPATAVDSTGAM